MGKFTKEEATPNTEAAYKKSLLQSTTGGLGQQALRVLRLLREEAKTSIELYHEGESIHPPARIRDLRKAGFQIITHWIYDQIPGGDLHKVGYYVLLAEPANQPGAWREVEEPLASLPKAPPSADAEQRKRDLKNWKKALEQTNPAYAKKLITSRLRDLGAIDDAGAAWLIEALNLAEV